jgi:DNA-binding beta-propeller fold protein YncE
VFTITAAGLEHAASIPVGLEPVAVAARNDGEVWVVNHLSDSSSVVNGGAAAATARCWSMTSRDVVFAGPAANAFIPPRTATTSAGRPQLDAGHGPCRRRC